MKPKLLVVDDLESGLALAEHETVESLFDGLVGGDYASMVALGWMRNEEHSKRLIEWIQSGNPDEEHAQGIDLAIIMDLGFRTAVGGEGRENIWDSLKEEIDSALVNASAIAEEASDGIAILLAMLKSKRLGRTAIIVASGRNNDGVVDFIEEYNSYCKKFRLQIFVDHQLGRIARTDSSGFLLKKVHKLWHETFQPDIHPDSNIAKFFQFLNAPSESDHERWSHAWCQSELGKEEAKAILDLSDISQNDIKGLFMMPPEESWYEVSPVAMRAVFLALDIRAKLATDDFNFRLPCQPGIAFLLALRQLQQVLYSDHQITDMEFRCDHPSDDYTRAVKIKVNSHTRGDGSMSVGGWGCIATFLKKLHSQGGNLNGDKGSLSEAIYNVGHCRVSMLENPLSDKRIALVQYGQGSWMAWPSFHKDSIEFRW